MGVKPRPIVSTGLNHFCWPPGKTPDVIKVFISGIQMTGKHVPADGTPSNGYFDMVRLHATSNRWSSGLPYPSARLELTSAMSQLTARSSLGSTCFWHEDLYNTCKKYYGNQMNPAYNPFGYGNAWATGYEFPWDVAELVMDAYWNDPNYECFPMPSDQLAIRVARIQDGTNIMIKFDKDLA